MISIENVNLPDFCDLTSLTTTNLKYPCVVLQKNVQYLSEITQAIPAYSELINNSYLIKIFD